MDAIIATGTQIGAAVFLLVGGGAGIGVLIRVFFEKKLRTPADRQTEVEFGVGLLRDQISKAERDAARWLEVETYLRDELRRTDTDKERLEDLLTKARQQITELTSERDELARRLTALASKVARGEPISMLDIAGSNLAADLENTEAQ